MRSARSRSVQRCLPSGGPAKASEQATAASIKQVIAWQLAEEMKRQNITNKRLAELMNTSRAQIDRSPDPEKGNVTIETLQRAAALLGRQIRLELV